MAKVLVIGYGNPLRSDDALGWKACERLSREVSTQEVDVVCCRDLKPEMAEQVAGAASVIFIEASTDGMPGQILVEKMSPADTAPPLYVHHIDPYALLACAKRVYGRCPEAMLVRVTGECFGFGTDLTPQLTNCLPGIVARVRTLMSEKTERTLAAALD